MGKLALFIQMGQTFSNLFLIILEDDMSRV